MKFEITNRFIDRMQRMQYAAQPWRATLRAIGSKIGLRKDDGLDDLDRTMLRWIEHIDAVYGRPDLSGANLRNAKLPNIDTSTVDLSSANLRNAKLDYAKPQASVPIAKE